MTDHDGVRSVGVSTLAGRRILVVGATGGIGGAVVDAIGARGATVIVAGRDQVALAAQRAAWLDAGIDVEDAISCDLAERDGVERLFADVDVDGVVFAAGVGSSGRALHDLDVEELERTITANTIGPLRVVRAVLPMLLSKPAADVVCIGSIVGQYPTGSALYGASKAAAHMMACNLRLELANESIRVIEVAPGRVKTDLFRRVRGDDAGEVLDRSEDFLEPTDVADCVHFALALPRRAQVNLIELMPSRQVVGGSRMV